MIKIIYHFHNINLLESMKNIQSVGRIMQATADTLLQLTHIMYHMGHKQTAGKGTISF